MISEEGRNQHPGDWRVKTYKENYEKIPRFMKKLVKYVYICRNTMIHA